METGNYNVHQNDRQPLTLSEECPISTTCMIFDECVHILNFFTIEKSSNLENSLFENRKTVFADPDADEENLASALITIATCNDQLCLVNKPGGQSIDDTQFNECLKLALDRQKSICKLITSILRK